jgi:hypothetical protein
MSRTVFNCRLFDPSLPILACSPERPFPPISVPVEYSPKVRPFRQLVHAPSNQGGTDARQVADLRRTKGRGRGLCR